MNEGKDLGATADSRLSELLFDFNVPDFFVPTWKPDEKHCEHGIPRVFACTACVTAKTQQREDGC